MPPRSTFDKELRGLQEEVLVLGSMVDKAIDRAIVALGHLDHEEARRIIHDDSEIDRKRYEIEERAIEVIATQQPMAGDLRTLVAILNIIVDLERMGDHAEGIAKIVLRHGEEPLLKPLVDTPKMAEKARGMLRRSLDALLRRDTELARQVFLEDDEVDFLHDQIYTELLGIMINDPSTISRATYLTWVAHNLERIADRATNICERVMFLATGSMSELNVSKY
ncbi:MAG TPA: phosphate signaling complex protein PhoU [Chloroflexota bacterium]|nr:phosphate signaling complex protein PhoU [Chloroflexota bacterium]